MVDVKFCGLTRREDAAFAAASGAKYVGVIFAGGPRDVTVERAHEVLEGAGTGAKRAGVFGADFAERIGVAGRRVPLDVVQLHGDPSADDVAAARAAFEGEVWAAVRVRGSDLPRHAAELFHSADAVLLDARVEGQLGGSGVALAWEKLAAQVGAVRGDAMLVLAGGLTPENVEVAIAALRPDVVDVSSGVESAPGIKDHGRMAAFANAARRSAR